jgi:hypothetical protein
VVSLKGGLVTRFVVILSTAAREYLLRIEPAERRLLTDSLVSALSSQYDRAVRVAGGSALLTEVGGYLITYRRLDDVEKKRYEAREGCFVMRISALWTGYPE